MEYDTCNTFEWRKCERWEHHIVLVHNCLIVIYIRINVTYVFLFVFNNLFYIGEKGVVRKWKKCIWKSDCACNSPVFPLISTYEPRSSSSVFKEIFVIALNWVFERCIKLSATFLSFGESFANLSSDKNAHISTRKLQCLHFRLIEFIQYKMQRILLIKRFLTL